MTRQGRYLSVYLPFGIAPPLAQPRKMLTDAAEFGTAAAAPILRSATRRTNQRE